MDERMIALVSAAMYVLTLAICVPEHLRRKSRENGVYLPGYFFWIGAAGGALFAVLNWIIPEADLFTVSIFACFVVLSSLLMLGWRNCYIVYDREGFTQKNLIGMYRRFGYEDVTGWYSHPTNPTESTVCALGKKVSFNLLSPNSAGFLTALGAGYRRTHGGENMPGRWKPERSSGFRAHVRKPEEFLFVFLLLVLFLVGAGGWIAWDLWTPLDGSECETLSVTFTDWSVEDEELKLTAEGYVEYFEIRGYPEFVPMPDALVGRCDGETVFVAQARRVNPDDGPDYYWIQALRADGVDYLTLADTTSYNRANLPILLGLFGGMLAIILALAGLMYLVGRNPKKYPKWLVNGLFKEGYIEY